MFYLVVFMLAIGAVSFFSTLHGIGLWLLLLITHGILHQYLGAGSEHLPLYAGCVVTVIILVRRQWGGMSFGNLLLFLSLGLIMSLSAIQGLHLPTSALHIMLFAKGFLLVLLLVGCLKDERDIKLMTLYCLAGFAIGALMALHQYMTGTFTINTIYLQRAASLRGDPNDTAMLLVAGVPLATYWLLNSRRFWVQGMALLVSLLLIAGIVLTLSRGGFVALLLVLSIIFLKRFSPMLAIGGVTLALLMAVLTPPSYWERMGTMFSGKEKHGGKSLESRLLLQQKGLDILLDHPALGVGPGNFGRAFLERYRPTTGFVRQGADSDEAKTYAVAHNMYLEFFAENGLVAGFLFLFIFFRAIRNLLYYDSTPKRGPKEFGLGFALALALGGMLLSGLFLSQSKNSVLWFMTGLGFAAGLIAERGRREITECPGTTSETDPHPASLAFSTPGEAQR